MTDLNTKAIFSALVSLGVGGTAPSVDQVCSGGQCRVYKVSFEDSQSLAVRVPMNTSTTNLEETIVALDAEWKTLKLLEAKGFRWAPKPRARNLSSDNPIQRPFLVLTWIEGSQLHWSEEFPPRPLRDTLLAQMAMIQMSLLRSTLEESLNTAANFFERVMRNRRLRIREGKIQGLSEQDCDDQQALFPQVLGTDGYNKLLAMDHGDFKPENIIVDSEYNIVCIIDWAFAGVVPLLRAAGPPRFLWGPYLSPAFQKDRQSYVASFADDNSQEAMYMQQFQTAADVDFRVLYVESLFSKGVHAFLAARDWNLSGEKLSVT